MIWGVKKKEPPRSTTEADPMARIEEVNADLQAYKEANDKRVSELSTKVQTNATDLGARVNLLREVMERQGLIPSAVEQSKATVKALTDKVKRQNAADRKKVDDLREQYPPTDSA